MLFCGSGVYAYNSSEYNCCAATLEQPAMGGEWVELVKVVTGGFLVHQKTAAYTNSNTWIYVYVAY